MKILMFFWEFEILTFWIFTKKKIWNFEIFEIFWNFENNLNFENLWTILKFYEILESFEFFWVYDIGYAI